MRLAGIFIAAFVLAGIEACTAPQVRTALDPRISRAATARCKAVYAGTDWLNLNPSILIHSEGAEVITHGPPERRQTVSVNGLRSLLVNLPVAAWPCGPIVGAGDISIRSGDKSEDLAIDQNHRAVEQVLKSLKITVIGLMAA